MTTSTELKCFTADPGLTTLYGLSYRYSNLPSTPSSDPNLMVLFRSQVDPKSLNDTQRLTVVATIPINTTVASVITRSNVFVACAVDSAGVFTVVVCDRYISGLQAEEASHFQAIRYNPKGRTGTENSVLGGKGDWSTIGVASDYNLTEFPIHNGHKLFYTVENGEETLLHAYASVVSPNNATVIRLGHVSNAGDRPLLEHSATYKVTQKRVVMSLVYFFSFI